MPRQSNWCGGGGGGGGGTAPLWSSPCATSVCAGWGEGEQCELVTAI
jgi:hypothetical protein